MPPLLHLAMCGRAYRTCPQQRKLCNRSPPACWPEALRLKGEQLRTLPRGEFFGRRNRLSCCRHYIPLPLLTLGARSSPSIPRVRPPLFGVLFPSSPTRGQTAYEPRGNPGQEGYCSGGNFLTLGGKGGGMPSHAYFAELTEAVLTDANEVKGFFQRQSPEERQAFIARMQERIVETFTKLLEVEIENGGQLQAWRDRGEGIGQAAQGAVPGAGLGQGKAELEARC